MGPFLSPAFQSVPNPRGPHSFPVVSGPLFAKSCIFRPTVFGPFPARGGIVRPAMPFMSFKREKK